MAKQRIHTGTDKQLPGADSLDLDIITIAEFCRLTTLSRTTCWRLTRTDPLLRAAFVRLTPTRAGLRRSGAAKWIATRTGRSVSEADRG